MAPPMHDELKSTSRHFIVAVALQAQEKPVTAVDELKRGVRKEYPIKYLEEIGAVPTPQNIALVEKEMGIDTNCKVSAAWKSRGSVHDSLYVAPRFPNQSLDAAAAAAAAEGGETLHAKEIVGSTSAASSTLTGTPLDFAIVNASLARQEQAMLDKLKVQRYRRPEARNKTQRQHFPGRRRQRPLRPGKTLYDNSKDESRSGDDLINDHGDVEATIAFLEATLNEGDKGLLLDGTQESADPDADPNTASSSQQRRARGVKLNLRFHSVDELKADFAALDVLNGAEAMSLTVPRSLRMDQDIGKPCVLERIPLTAAMMEELQEPFTLVLGRHREQLENVLKELNLLCLRANLGGLIQVGPVLNIVDHACMLVFRQILLKYIDADGLGASRELPDAAACRSALVASFRRHRTSEALFATRVLVDVFFFSVYRNSMAELACSETQRAKVMKQQVQQSQRQMQTDDTMAGLEDCEFALREKLRRQEQLARSTELSKLYNPARCKVDALLCGILDKSMLLRLSPGLSGHTTRRLPSLKAICGHGQGSTHARLLRLKTTSDIGSASSSCA